MVSKYDIGSLDIIKIEGIGSKYEKVLKKQGIETTADLLRKAETNEKRLSLAESTGINLKLINQWVSCADLIRVKGIGEEYSDLLNHLGIHTVQQLAAQDPRNLFNSSEKLDVSKTHLVRKRPRLDQIQSWIKDAKTLTPLIEEPVQEFSIIEKPIIINEKKPAFEFIDPYVANTQNVSRDVFKSKEEYSIADDPLLPLTITLAILDLLIGLTWLFI